MQINNDIEVVITSFNQKSMIYEAVHSLCRQTIRPKRMVIVDDGSTDEASIDILHEIEADEKLSVPVRIIRQKNSGVSAARNTGISETESPLVVALDGDDSLEPSYIEEVSKILHENPSMVAASSWLQTFGVLEAVVRPKGGDVSSFLARNCCPATHMFRRDAWKQCGGYDEAMRSGFEDWDFFLGMLEAVPDTYIGMVEKPLINYRTTPASSNIKSMEKRLELMRYIVEKHRDVYQEHVVDAILGMESISMSRLYGWENEINYAQLHGKHVSSEAKTFIENPSYGDGGMAAAVRIVSMENQI